MCNVHSSPEAELVWYRGNMRLVTDNRMYREDMGVRRSLVIHHVREEEFTQYRCQATNSLGSDAATITITGRLYHEYSSREYRCTKYLLYPYKDDICFI